MSCSHGGRPTSQATHGVPPWGLEVGHFQERQRIRLTCPINRSLPGICSMPHPAPGAGDAGEGDTPLPSRVPSPGRELLAKPRGDHTGWEARAPGRCSPPAGWGVEGLTPATARVQEGRDQEDLSEMYPSKSLVTSSHNDFQLLWSTKSSCMEGNWRPTSRSWIWLCGCSSSHGAWSSHPSAGPFHFRLPQALSLPGTPRVRILTPVLL